MVNASFCWLNNVKGVYLVQLSLLLIGRSSVGAISSSIGPCFSLAGWLCKFYARARGKLPIQRQPLLVQYKQQVNQLFSMHNYTPLVISGNDKNKQKTLQSLRKLALTARNTLFEFKIIGAPKNVYKWPFLVFSLYLGRQLSILHTVYRYHRKPNPSPEKVPIIGLNVWMVYRWTKNCLTRAWRWNLPRLSC